jgi:hypothetical protein
MLIPPLRHLSQIFIGLEEACIKFVSHMSQALKSVLYDRGYSYFID